jgi:riboflavin kinase/FMN adenylyltransferase
MILNTLEEKEELMQLQGINHFIVLPFTKEFSEMSSTQFIEEYLFKRIGIKGLIMGHDHRFGKDRLGNSEQLAGSAEKFGFFIEEVDPFCIGSEKVSSTRIRNALFNGDIELANSMLSRNYSISGFVEKGHKIGRNIGFPTANIRPDYNYKLIPGDGVYAVKVLIDNKEFTGMLNIGIRPTVNKGNENKSIEVHIFDFNEDIYGKKISLMFYRRIRNELKFKSIEELKNQLTIDMRHIKGYFDSF